MENIKASLAMYFAMIDRRVDDEDETDPRLLYGLEVSSPKGGGVVESGHDSIHARHSILFQV